MREPIIQRVSDSQEKFISYKVQRERYSKAVRNGFYYEAIVIIYAMIEKLL